MKVNISTNISSIASFFKTIDWISVLNVIVNNSEWQQPLKAFLK